MALSRYIGDGRPPGKGIGLWDVSITGLTPIIRPLLSSGTGEIGWEYLFGRIDELAIPAGSAANTTLRATPWAGLA